MVTQNTNKTQKSIKNTVVVKRFHFLDDSNYIKAFADVLVDDVLLIKGCRVIKGEKGPFVSFPTNQGKDGKYYKIVDSKEKEFVAQFQESVLKQFEEEYAKRSGRNYQE
ncbi:MAG: septation protein SpoVG family protein [Candidatus Omnitrophica bacterium]|nr:septation protein SpoVG family protein [Candidatus Omnitrophota bacterium]